MDTKGTSLLLNAVLKSEPTVLDKYKKTEKYYSDRQQQNLGDLKAFSIKRN